jgi:hypothetical protein
LPEELLAERLKFEENWQHRPEAGWRVGSFANFDRMRYGTRGSFFEWLDLFADAEY